MKEQFESALAYHIRDNMEEEAIKTSDRIAMEMYKTFKREFISSNPSVMNEFFHQIICCAMSVAISKINLDTSKALGLTPDESLAYQYDTVDTVAQLCKDGFKQLQKNDLH